MMMVIEIALVYGVFSTAITYIGYCDMLAGLELHWCNNLEVVIIISAMIIGVWL